MATKKQTHLALGAVAAVGLGYLVFRRKKQPLFITSGGSLDAFSGQQFTVRLPRGQYAMMGGDGLTLVAQTPVGDGQDLVIAVNDAILPFQVTPTFIDEGDDENQHTITVNVEARE
jgi:hypothetical protein